MSKYTNMQIGKALNTIDSASQWTLAGDNYENIEWLSSTPQPTWSEVEAEINNPTPQAEPTIQDKLARVGLNLDDLKTALGI